MIQAQDENRVVDRPVATKKASQALLDAVEKVQRLQQQQTSLPSIVLSEAARSLEDNEMTTKIPNASKKDVETKINSAPIRPIPESITPPRSVA